MSAPGERPLVVIRPEPGCAGTVAAARAAGFAAQGYPLFAVAPVAWQAPDAAACRGLLAGSANVFRHGGPGLAGLRDLPVHAVGGATAEAARAAGFSVTETGEGGMQPIAARLAPGRYLRLAGERHVPLAPAPGAEVETIVVYAAAPVSVPPALDGLLRAGAPVVLLHSGEAARHLAAECARLEIDRAAIALACLAPRIAESAGPGWRAVGVAKATTDDALLALARQMCQTT